MDEIYFGSTDTFTIKGETRELKDNHFYCLEEVELKRMANIMFEKAYKQLEKALFFSVMLGVIFGMIIMACIK